MHCMLLHRYWNTFVSVIHDESSLWNISKKIFLLRLWCLHSSLSSSRCFWFGFFLLLFLLWFRIFTFLVLFRVEFLVPFVVKSCHLFAKCKITKDSFEVGLIDTGQEPAIDITICFTELGIQNLSIQHQHIARQCNICK